MLVRAIGIALVVLMSAGWSSTARAVELPTCDSSSLGTYSVVSGATAKLVVRRRDSGEHEIPLSVTGCVLPPNARIAGLIHDFENGDGATIPPSKLQVVATRTGKTTASLHFRLQDRKDVAAGTYSGTLQLDGDETLGHVLSIPATITLQYQNLWIAIIVPWLVTLVVGSGTLWLRLLVAEQSWKTWKSLLAVGAGLVAALGVWRTQYLTVESWGGSLTDFIGLITLMVSGYIAAATAISAATDAAARS
jgi:hypothetical protein